jgi:DNA-binding Lrp family transcriptional regulator
MLSKKELLILCHLRVNARETLTEISKKTSVPISTIFDKLKLYEGNLIKHHTTLINFAQLGFNTRANIMIKVDRDVRDVVKDYLSRHQNINSVFKINNGFDYMFEAIFVNIKDMEDFMENLDKKYKIENKQVYYIVEDIKKESFMTNPDLINIVVNN